MSGLLAAQDGAGGQQSERERAKGTQVSCLTVVQSTVLKYRELQYCAALHNKRQNRQFRQFVVGKRNCYKLLRNVEGIVTVLNCKRVIVLPSEEHIA